MRHRVKGKKLNRDMGHRKALRRNLMIELCANEEIITTKAKAQAVRGEFEKLVTKAKHAHARGDEGYAVHARRIILSRLGNNRQAMFKIYDELAPRYQDRPGGYTRVFKVGTREGDNADLVMLQLIPEDENV